ncbi:SusC/RagA family TonB-linked outer membrane protein [Arcticibacter tournemirensis]|uniref:SusC/RagA family TonB-linked outer membrane protein n=2 Tax=Arcticibacter tournemirensis TaxID=699437 RepID=A0A4Q0MBV3_9SPHI|nr:SusC/RagA family TonB-linked outer membrane protein [Arcticibacter tournemirensis]
MQVCGAVVAQKITFRAREISLKEVFNEINRQTEYNVFWSPRLVRNNIRINANFKDATLQEVLGKALKDLPLTYTLEGKNVIIRETPVTEQSPVQQDIRISGTVKDERGETLPGVSVRIKGTSVGRITDNNGKFVLSVSGTGSVIEVSFVGFISQEIPVGSRTSFDIILKEQISTLEEVAVVAFGTQKKSSTVSSIETINPKELKVPSSNLTTALAGRLSGVIAYQRSGEPGMDNAEFFIRGVTTFGYKQDPLILIDGIETNTTELARLQPDDIAAFSILKDATATALYGARGANGVIQVTTKQGTVGEAQVSVRLESSFSSNTHNIEFADPVTFMNLANEATMTRTPNAPLAYPREKIANTVPGADPLLYPANDWRSLLMKDVTNNQRLNFNISGGGQVARYYIAGTANQDQGNLKVDKINNFNNNIDLKSYQLRSNININLSKTTEAIVRVSGSFDDYRGPIDGGEEMYKKIVRSNPVAFPAFYPAELMPGTKHTLFGNATRANGEGANYINPYAEMVRGYKDYSKSLMYAQFEMKQDLKFLLPGLNIRGMFNTSRYSYFDVRRFYNPYYYSMGYYDPGSKTYTLSLLNEDANPTEYLNYDEGDKQINTTTYLESSLLYSSQFNKVHDVSGMLVYQRREQLNANQGSLQKSLPYRNQGLSGRFTYGYDNRYLFEFNFGYNGSERFYKSERYGFFPAVGAGWVISNENFWENLRNVVSNLKLRATYGLVGNDAIGDENDRFFYLSDVNMNDGSKGYTFGENYAESSNGVGIYRYDNKDISWESATKTNIGLELGLFRDINFQADFFTEKRKNILMNRNIPADVGLSAAVRANVGEAKAYGVDMSLDYNKSLSKNMWIQARGNFTYAHSEFLKYEEPAYNEKYKTHIGQSLKQIYGLVAERMFVDEYEVSNSPKQNYGEYKAGDIKYRDVNNDGQITDLDMVPIGYPTVPEIVYGFGFSYGYKNFDFSAFFQGSARSSFWLDASNTSPFQNDVALLKAYADSHWSEENRDIYAVWPRLSTGYSGNNFYNYSTWFMRNGAFLRMKTIELGYKLPTKLTNRFRMSSARIYATGNNLFLLSGFDMWDIEMGGRGLGYPIQKVINFGIQVRF